MSNSILISVENACFNVAYSASVSASNVTPDFPDVTIYNGLDNSIKTGSVVITSALTAKEMYHGLGIYTVHANVTVKEQHSDTNVSDRGVLSGVIFGIFHDDNIINNLNSQGADCSVVDLFNYESVNTTEGKAWVQTLSFDLVSIAT